jgi:hypothetical protein
MSQAARHTALWEEVRAQAAANPAIYGRIDFSGAPERFTTDMSDVSALRGPFRTRRQALLTDQDRVDLIKVYTMTGDRVADTYAALMSKYGFGKLVQMLKTACESGLDAVADAPPE